MHSAGTETSKSDNWWYSEKTGKKQWIMDLDEIKSNRSFNFYLQISKCVSSNNSIGSHMVFQQFIYIKLYLQSVTWSCNFCLFISSYGTFIIMPLGALTVNNWRGHFLMNCFLLFHPLYLVYCEGKLRISEGLPDVAATASSVF